MIATLSFHPIYSGAKRRAAPGAREHALAGKSSAHSPCCHASPISDEGCVICTVHGATAVSIHPFHPLFEALQVCIDTTTLRATRPCSLQTCTRTLTRLCWKWRGLFSWVSLFGRDSCLLPLPKLPPL